MQGVGSPAGGGIPTLPESPIQRGLHLDLTPKSPHDRTLQQLQFSRGATPFQTDDVIPDVTVVRSASALLEEITRGTARIEIRAHLDLTELASATDDNGFRLTMSEGDSFGSSYVLGTVPSTVQSIRVRLSCTQPKCRE